MKKDSGSSGAILHQGSDRLDRGGKDRGGSKKRGDCARAIVIVIIIVSVCLRLCVYANFNVYALRVLCLRSAKLIARKKAEQESSTER